MEQMENTDEVELDWAAVNEAVRQFAVVSEQEKVLAKRKKELRDRLMALVQEEGQEDDKGHLYLPLPEEQMGVYALTVQRRVTNSLDGDVAEEILKGITVDGATLWDACIEWVAVLDEDKIMAARYENQLTDEQIDAMFPRQITEAFTPAKRRK